MVYPHAASVSRVCRFSCHIQLWCERSGGRGKEWRWLCNRGRERDRNRETAREGRGTEESETEVESGEREIGVQTGQRHYSQSEHILAVMVQTGMRPPPPQAHRSLVFESGLQLLVVWGGWGSVALPEQVCH